MPTASHHPPPHLLARYTSLSSGVHRRNIWFPPLIQYLKWLQGLQGNFWGQSYNSLIPRILRMYYPSYILVFVQPMKRLEKHRDLRRRPLEILLVWLGWLVAIKSTSTTTGLSLREVVIGTMSAANGVGWTTKQQTFTACTYNHFYFGQKWNHIDNPDELA